MAAITEDYVSFETAKLLKEKGFNEECFALYNPDGVLIQSGIRLNNTQVSRVKDSYTAPTQQMAMKWLREVHGLFIYIGVYRDQEGDSSDYNYWNWCIDNVNTTLTIAENEYIIPYETYEQAAEAGIKYCLENLI